MQKYNLLFCFPRSHNNITNEVILPQITPIITNESMEICTICGLNEIGFTIIQKPHSDLVFRDVPCNLQMDILL